MSFSFIFFGWEEALSSEVSADYLISTIKHEDEIYNFEQFLANYKNLRSGRKSKKLVITSFPAPSALSSFPQSARRSCR